MDCIGKDLKDDLAPRFLAMGRDTFHQTRLFKGPSNLAWNIARVGASITSLGNLWSFILH